MCKGEEGGTEGSISGGTAFKGEEAICGESYESYKWVKGRGRTEGTISGGTAFKGEEAMCGEPYKREEGIHGEGELEGL